MRGILPLFLSFTHKLGLMKVLTARDDDEDEEEGAGAPAASLLRRPVEYNCLPPGGYSSGENPSSPTPDLTGNISAANSIANSSPAVDKRSKFKKASDSVLDSSSVTYRSSQSPLGTPTTNHKAYTSNHRASNGSTNQSAVMLLNGTVPRGENITTTSVGGDSSHNATPTHTLLNGDRNVSSNQHRRNHLEGSQRGKPGGAGGGSDGYATVACEDSDETIKKKSMIKCKPAVTCHKLREYQRDLGEALTTNEHSMIQSAIVELEQITPRSRLANCEVVFFGPDPAGNNPVFFAGNRRNKYLVVWQEERQAPVFVVREESANLLAPGYTRVYLGLIVALLVFLYQYWLLYHLVDTMLSRLINEGVRMTMDESSQTTVRIVGPIYDSS